MTPFVVLLDARRSSRFLSPCPYVGIDIIMRLLVPLVIKMRDLAAMCLLPWTKATMAALSMLLLCRLRTRLWLVGILAPFGARSAIATRFIEARRRTAKGAALLVEPTRRPRAKACGTIASLGVFLGPGCRATPRPRRALRSRETGIILLALRWDGENVVGLADGDEAVASVGVVLIAVRVMLFGESIKLAFDFSGSG